jgi:hypothetical protein
VDFRAVDFLRPVDFLREPVDFLRLDVLFLDVDFLDDEDLRAVDFLREPVDFLREPVDFLRLDVLFLDDVDFLELVDFLRAVDFLRPPDDFLRPPDELPPDELDDPPPEALPPLFDAPGEFEIAAARPLLMPFFLRPSYCLSFLTLEPWSFAIHNPLEVRSCEPRAYVPRFSRFVNEVVTRRWSRVSPRRR